MLHNHWDKSTKWGFQTHNCARLHANCNACHLLRMLLDSRYTQTLSSWLLYLMAVYQVVAGILTEGIFLERLSLSSRQKED